LWSAVRTYAGNVPLTPARAFGDFYGTGDADLIVVQAPPLGPSLISGQGPFIRFCPTCPEYETRIFALVGDPALYDALGTGLVRIRNAPEGLRQFYEDVTSGAVNFVESAEPLGRQAMVTPPGTPMVRGIVLEGGLVGSYFVQNALDETARLSV